MPHNHDASKTNRPLTGVTCNVTNCTYNENSYECKASEICIDPGHALTSKQTACSTFKSKSSDND